MAVVLDWHSGRSKKVPKNMENLRQLGVNAWFKMPDGKLGTNTISHC